MDSPESIDAGSAAPMRPSDIVRLARAGRLEELAAAVAGGAAEAHIGDALRAAAATGRSKCVALLAARCDVGEAGADGETALSLAAAAGDAESVETLLRAGASIEAANPSGRGPLHVASSMNLTGSMAALIAAGANVEARDRLGKTPLMLAVQFGAADAARLLHGRCDLEAVDAAGFTALDHARALAGAPSPGAQAPDARARAAREIEPIARMLEEAFARAREAEELSAAARLAPPSAPRARRSL